MIESGRDWSVVDGDSSNTSGIGDNAVSSESFPDRIELGCDADEAVSLIRTLADAGFVAYLAGGCVRDALLGITPKDYDVATNATPQAVRKVFGKSRTLAFGASFGVIGVLPPNQQRENVHQQVTEVATFRSDGTYSDGRRPDSVHFGDPEQDALRRDFTINGLFYDPVDDRLIDFVGGRQDLRSGLLRTIGDPNDRFAEDRLRMLRAVRFAATLGFEIDPATRSAVVQHSRSLEVVSGERIGAEMRRLLVSRFALRGINDLVQLDLAGKVLPELLQMQISSVAARCEAARSDDFRYQLAAILSLSSDPSQALRGVSECWKLSNEETRAISSALKFHRLLTEFNETAWSVTQPIMINRDIESILDLAAVIAESQPNDQWRRSVSAARQRLDWSKDRLNPDPFLTGDDLRELGVPPGPEYSKLLSKARSLQLDGELTSHEAATRWVLTRKER